MFIQRVCDFCLIVTVVVALATPCATSPLIPYAMLMHLPFSYYIPTLLVTDLYLLLIFYFLTYKYKKFFFTSDTIFIVCFRVFRFVTV